MRALWSTYCIREWIVGSARDALHKHKTAAGKASCMSSSLSNSIDTPWHIIINRVLEIVAAAPGCQITYVAGLIPDVTLEEIVVALSYLKRRGQLNVLVGNQGAVSVTLSPRLFH